MHQFIFAIRYVIINITFNILIIAQFVDFLSVQYKNREGAFMKKYVNVFDYAKEIMQALPKGVLLTTKADGKVNTMTIGWGTLGIEWAKPVFIAFVREHRFTRSQLDKSGEFTINVPLGEFNKKILGYCGTHSGRDTDKIADLNLTLENGEKVDAPAIRELPLTLECRVIYKQKQELSALPPEIQHKSYPQDVDSSFSGANKDIHIAYYGEIVNAYIVE